MASSPVFISKAVPSSDTMAKPRPFADARNFRERPAEKPKLCSTLFYEDECRRFSRTLPCGDWPLQKRIGAAISLPDAMKKIANKKIISEAVASLKKTMLTDSEHPSLRMACAVSLGSSGYGGLVGDMVCDVLKKDKDEIPLSSKLLALKVLAIHRSEEAIEQLGLVAQYGDNDALCTAAARELLGIPLFPAQKIVNEIICSPPGALLDNPEFFEEFRRLADCILPVN